MGVLRVFVGGVGFEFGIVCLLSEIANVHEFFGVLNVGNHPEDEENETSAEDEKRKVYTECGGAIEGFQSVLE